MISLTKSRILKLIKEQDVKLYDEALNWTYTSLKKYYNNYLS